MKLYLAGSSQKSVNDPVMSIKGVNKLWSYLNDKSNIAEYINHNSTMIDSGAHSFNKVAGSQAKRKNLPPIQDFFKSYVEFCVQHKHKDWVFVELDVYTTIGTEAVDEMYRYAQSKGVNLMRVYHVQIDGGTCNKIREWQDEGHKYIGIALDSVPILNRVFSTTRDKTKVHGFAMIAKKFLDNYPFFSCDSSSWLSPMQYGNKRSTITGKPIDKQKAIKTRDACMFQQPFEISLAYIHNLIKQQDYYARLWAKRGVVWTKDSSIF